MLFTKPVSTIFSRTPSKRKLSHIPKKNLNWWQAKKRYPNLKPFGDADKDGVINILDCKPFNKKRQDEDQDEMNYQRMQHDTRSN